MLLNLVTYWFFGANWSLGNSYRSQPAGQKLAWFLRAWFSLAKWHVTIKLRGYEAWRDDVVSPAKDLVVSYDTPVDPNVVCHVVHKAADNHLFILNCLRRCVVAREILRKEGVLAVLHFGVRSRMGQESVHCWLTVNDQILGDSEEHVEKYQELDLSRRKGIDWLAFLL